jgi:hypothetical protein
MTAARSIPAPAPTALTEADRQLSRDCREELEYERRAQSEFPDEWRAVREAEHACDALMYSRSTLGRARLQEAKVRYAAAQQALGAAMGGSR